MRLHSHIVNRAPAIGLGPCLGALLSPLADVMADVTSGRLAPDMTKGPESRAFRG